VRLATTKADEPIKDSQELQVSGRGYTSAEAAGVAATRWQGILEKALARNKIGANFGLRHARANAMFTAAFLAQAEQAAGTKVLTDHLGITIFEYEPESEPLFLSLKTEGHPGRLPEHVLASIRAADENNILVDSDRERLAYELYSASFTVSYPDARFMLLMMAVETLIEQHERSVEALAHIDKLIASTATSGLDRREIDSLTQSFMQLRLESVGRAGRRLMKESLAGRSYREKSPQDFFQDCYQLRSRLVHGAEDRPSSAGVENYTVELEVLLTDLLGDGLPEPR